MHEPTSLSPIAIPMRGTLQIVVRDARTLEERKRITIKNKITFLAADVLVELLAQRAAEVPATNRIYSLRVGSTLLATPVARTDTNLGTFVAGMALADVNKTTVAQGELQFSATLDASTGNGSTLTEAGLFTAGTLAQVNDPPGTATGTTRMFARQIHPGIPKNIAIVLDYSWTIAFTAP